MYMLQFVSFQEIIPVNVVLKSTRDILSEKLVKTAVKMVTTQRKRKNIFYIKIIEQQIKWNGI